MPNLSNSMQISLLNQLVIPPYPTSTQLSFLLPDEIAEAAQTYLYAVTLFLQLDRDSFITASDIHSPPGQQMIALLASYVNQRVSETPSLCSPDFDEKIFNLIFRFISEGRDISIWLDWQFVINVTAAWYDSRQDELAALLSRTWRRARQKMILEFSQLKEFYMNSFESIVLDGSNALVATFNGLRCMVSLNNDIVDILVDREGELLITLHDHYSIYRVHLSEAERDSLLYLFYTILVSLAYRTSESSVGQSKKGKAAVGSAETLFFEIFDRLFGEYIREGSFDALIEDLSQETPFVEIMSEWIQDWKGAEEAVETLTEYISRIKIEELAGTPELISDEVYTKIPVVDCRRKMFNERCSFLKLQTYSHIWAIALWKPV